jgi:hypothetical protein
MGHPILLMWTELIPGTGKQSVVELASAEAWNVSATLNLHHRLFVGSNRTCETKFRSLPLLEIFRNGFPWSLLGCSLTKQLKIRIN